MPSSPFQLQVVLVVVVVVVVRAACVRARLREPASAARAAPDAHDQQRRTGSVSQG